MHLATRYGISITMNSSLTCINLMSIFSLFFFFFSDINYMLLQHAAVLDVTVWWKINNFSLIMSKNNIQHDSFLFLYIFLWVPLLEWNLCDATQEWLFDLCVWNDSLEWILFADNLLCIYNFFFLFFWMKEVS